MLKFSINELYIQRTIVSDYRATATPCNTLQHTATHCNTLQPINELYIQRTIYFVTIEPTFEDVCVGMDAQRC